MNVASAKDISIGPFSLNDENAFSVWAEQKLANYPLSAESLAIAIADPENLTQIEISQLRECLQKTNMVVYRLQQSEPMTKKQLRLLGQQLGLTRLDPNMLADEDGVTSLEVVPGKSVRGYIPYTNKRLQWHTDGYYNTDERRIRAFILHCIRPARLGGENCLLDPEIVYLYMRRENPEYIQAFMADNAMTIPANTESGSETRAVQTGPVFAVMADGSLHMRYTARTRSIEWAQDSTTQAACDWLQDFLASDIPYICKYKLAANEGVITNNALHTRTEFEQDEQQQHSRLLFRARYYDSVRLESKSEGN